MAIYREKYVLDGLDHIPDEMMKDLDLSFDVCSKLLDIRECECCGKCCHQPNIMLMDKEIGRIAAHLDLEEKEFIGRYLRRENGRWLFSKTSNGPCAFLEECRCSIWSERPEICRDFPYMVSKLMSIVYLALVYGKEPDLSYMDDDWPCTSVIKENLERSLNSIMKRK